MNQRTVFSFVLPATCAACAALALDCDDGDSSAIAPIFPADASASGPPGARTEAPPVDAGSDVARYPVGPVDATAVTTATPDAGAGGGPGAGGPGTRAEAGAPVVEASAPTSYLRFADWAPDVPSGYGLDICLVTRGTSTVSGPLIGAGVPFPLVSRYLSVAPGRYDLRVIARGAGSPDCSSGVSASGLPELVANGHMTFALVGSISPRGNDPPAKITTFLDQPLVSSDSQATVRFINATPASAAADFGGGSLRAGNFSALVNDVQFGRAVSPTGTGTDVNGYVLAPPRSASPISAHTVGASTDLAVASNAAWNRGSLATVVLVNGANNGPPPQFLVCLDNAPAEGAFAACSILTQ
jgi:hypothetical protein